jgi:glycosyltransferase involved in cell wall biosynthesis
MSYELKDLSVVLPSYNNLEYLKLAYKSIRDISDDIEIILYGDGCTDGTNEWLLELSHKNTFTHIYSEKLGHPILYDYGFQTASRPVIGILHADMIVHKNFFENILKHIGTNKIVCAMCVEPPIHPPGKEKYQLDAGTYPNEFNQSKFDEFYESVEKNTTNNGIFAPWFLLKDEYLNILGGHDPQFQTIEDVDIFNRMVIGGFDIIQSRDALVYHFTQRGHKFEGGDLQTIQHDYQSRIDTDTKKYVRKWGGVWQFDINHRPIPTTKYNIGLIIYNAPLDLVVFLEPYFTTIYTNNLGQVEGVSKLKDINDELTNDSFVTVNAEHLTNENIEFLLKIPYVLKQNTQTGAFKVDIFNLYIKNYNEYQNELIKVN